MENGIFAAQVKVSRSMLIQADNTDFFERYVKRNLYAQASDLLIPGIVDSGKHHVLKAEIFRQDEMDTINFYLKIHHSIAKEQHIILPVLDDIIPASAKPCCQWCGNELNLDKRGGCSACGGWPKS